MNDEGQNQPPALVVRSWFVRGRNVLMTRADLGPLYVDYYLHLMQHNIRHDEPPDAMLKDALAVMALHLCSRPQDETSAWTIHLGEPLLNLFVTGSSRPGRLTGRIFTEDIKQDGGNLLIAQTTRAQQAPRQSVVEFTGTDMLAAAETFYERSEQRLTRIFREEGEHFSMLTAEPDADLAWLAALRLEDLPLLPEREVLVPMETRGYAFECGCSIDRLFPLLSRLPKEDLEEVFADGRASITCPRCGARDEAPREVFDKWRATAS